MTKLLVVCSENEKNNVSAALDYAVRRDEKNKVEVWTLRNNSELLNNDNDVAFWDDIPSDIQVIATKSVKKFPSQRLMDSGCSVRVVSREGFFERDSLKLERFLQTLKMCWKDQVEDAYERYDHRVPDFGVEQWLGQFDLIGDRALGRALLKHVEVIPTDECVNILAKSFVTQNGDNLSYVATLSRMGKSGAALSGGLRRKLECEPIVLTDAIEQAASSANRNTIHVFEDGLWTGIELSRVLDSLAGTTVKPKMPALSDPAMLHKHNVVLHFALATDIGVYAAKSLLAQWKLTNFSLAVGDSKMIDILDEDGKNGFERGDFSFGHVKDFSSKIKITPRIVALLSSDMDQYGLIRAKDTIRTIGSQLWAANSGIAIGSEVPLNVEFGANGIGSTTLFRHSSPRAVLPMLWASGYIKWGSRRIHWKALFPENGPLDHAKATLSSSAIQA